MTAFGIVTPLPRHYWLGFLGRFGHHFVSLRDAHHFFDGCFPLGDTPPAVLPQSFHAFGNRALLELAVHRTSALSVFLTVRLPGKSHRSPRDPDSRSDDIDRNLRRAELFQGKTDLAKVFAWIIHQLRAVWTNCAHEPLRDERFHHRGEQERFHVHVEQAGDAADGIVRVQRAENEMTRHGRSDRDVRRVDIANFAAARTSVSVTRPSDRFSLHWQEQRHGPPRFDARPATLSRALLRPS
jgi:hypothetical protein